MDTTTAITAIGTGIPAYRESKEHVIEFMSTVLQLVPGKKRILQSICNNSGIHYRHSVLSDYVKSHGEFSFFPNDPNLSFPDTAVRMGIYATTALPLALAAIENCLSSLPYFNLHTITHLITISCTGMYAPGLDLEILQTLHLPTSIKRTAVNFMGCHGVFNGLRLADAICKANPNAKVLVVSVELCTLHFQKNDSMDNLISSSLFADGAAAALVEANPSQDKYVSFTDFYCDVLPQTQREMTWSIGNSGFDMVLTSYVPQAIEFGIAHFVEKLLTQQQLDKEPIDFYAIHPGGMKILQACEQALNISSEDLRHSYQILRDHGNMSSATILFLLKLIWDNLDTKHHQQNILSCAFGPGLTLESLLLRIHHTELAL